MIKLEFTNAQVRDNGYGLEVNGKSLENIISTALGTRAGSHAGYNSGLPAFESNCCDVAGTKKGQEFIEFLDNYQRYKECGKLLGTYIDKIPAVKCEKTDAVHTTFNQYGAKTGRFSSSDTVTKINLQNIPSHEKRIRKIFRAREGYKMVGGDFSQIEPRVLSYISGDEAMQDAYIHGKDL